MFQKTTTCHDEALGALLPLYERDDLDATGRAVFVRHLRACGPCLARFAVRQRRPPAVALPQPRMLDWLPVPLVVATLLLLCLRFPAGNAASQYSLAKVGVVSQSLR